jgi:hypothetical protein
MSLLIQKNANKLPIIALAFYFQGLQLYFYITGLFNFKPVWLTAFYQIGLLLLTLWGVVRNSATRKKLVNFGYLEISYLIFYMLFVLDLLFFRTNSFNKIPDFALIYFTTYTCSLLIAKALSLDRIKLFLPISNLISSVTCILLLLQFFSGSASLVGGGVRLATGATGNPINTGYLGCYCTVTSLILLLANHRKNIYTKLYYLVSMLAGLYVGVLAGTRSPIIYLVISTLTIILVKLWLSIFANKTNSSLRKFMKTNSLFLLGLMFALVVSIIIFPNILASGQESLLSNLGERLSRLNTIWEMFSTERVSGIDRSVSDRVSVYQLALKIFLENPVYGGGIYSAGTVHNAFLQSATELGILGIVTFGLPCAYLGLFCFKKLITIGCDRDAFDNHNSNWVVSIFCWTLFVNAMCIWLFHGDPYRGYLQFLIAGILIAYSKTNIGKYE